MKRFLTLALVAALGLGVSSAVYANVCAFDPVPAATLLFPFVAYDYDGGFGGDTTIFSITNVSAEAQIVHVTLWTDYSIAILDFNILLTGYDTQRVNIRDILADGQLPVTVIATHAQTPGNEGVFPDGPVSPDNDNGGGGANTGSWIQGLLEFPESTNDLGSDRCSTSDQAYPGLYADNLIPATQLAAFQDWLQASQTASRSHANDCSPPYGPAFQISPDPWFYLRDETDPTWMYITADVVETCNLTFPDNPAYYVDEIRYDNVLIGDVTWLNNDERFSEVDNAIHIEADIDLAQVATINADNDRPVSFYHRYSQNAQFSDYREPLPTAWAFRYQGAQDDGTLDTLIRAWKGSSLWPTVYDLEFNPPNVGPDSFIASNCYAYTYYAWDEDEDVITVTDFPWSQPGGGLIIPNLLPLETQEVSVDEFDTVDTFGWMLFVWPASNYVGIPGAPAPPDFYQTWMGVKYVKAGDYSAATSGAVMANFNCFSDQVLPNLGIDYNYVDQFGYVSSPSLFE